MTHKLYISDDIKKVMKNSDWLLLVPMNFELINIHQRQEYLCDLFTHPVPPQERCFVVVPIYDGGDAVIGASVLSVFEESSWSNGTKRIFHSIQEAFEFLGEIDD